METQKQKAVLYPAPESRKRPQQRREMVDVLSVCRHIRRGTDSNKNNDRLH